MPGQGKNAEQRQPVSSLTGTPNILTMTALLSLSDVEQT
jgi:hypothetical protein